MQGTNIQHRISLQGGADVKRQLQEIGTTGEHAVREIEAAANGVNFEKFARSLLSGMAGVHANTEGVKQGFEALGEAFTEMGGLAGGASGEVSKLFGIVSKFATGSTGLVAAVVGLGAAMAGLAVHGAEAAAAIREGATRVGTTTDNYTGLSFAFRQSGSSGEAFERAMVKIAEAQGKAGDSAEMYAAQAKAAAAADEARRRASEQLAEQMLRLSENSREQALSGRIALGEEMRRIRMQSQREEENLALAHYREMRKSDEEQADAQAKGGQQLNAERSRLLRQRQDEESNFQVNLSRMREHASDQQIEAQRADGIRIAAEHRRQQLEADRALREYYQKQAEAARKYQEDISEAKRAAGDKFGAIGVELMEGRQARDPTEVFRDAADKIAGIQNVAQRSATAVELFGRRVGAQLVEVLAKGRAGIDDLMEESKKLGLLYSSDELSIGKHFVEDIDKLRSVISATLGKIGLAFAPLFGSVADALAKAIGNAQGPMVAAAEGLAKALKPIFDDIGAAIEGNFAEVHSTFIVVMARAIQVLGMALRLAYDAAAAVGHGMMELFGPVAEQLNKTFGLQVSGGDIAAFAVALRAMIPIFSLLRVAFMGIISVAGGPWVIAIRLAAAALLALLPIVMENMPAIEAWFTRAAIAIAAAWQQLGATLQQTWLAAASAIESTVNTVVDWFLGAWHQIQNGFHALVTWIGQKINEAIGFILGLVKAAEQAAAAIANAIGAGSGSSTSTGAQGHASGGYIAGPGGIDNVPAWLTAGEFVMRTAAVQKYGLSFLHALNQGLVPALHFHTGGLVPRRAMGFAAGGLVPAGADGGSRSGFTLVLDGKSFDATSDRAVADSLFRTAKTAQLKAIGRRPSWVGG